mmetsp:Transcript_7780/g.15430  ORF Transcript_7780/g.15430 Transcript_7780/m.15430 type:complete len:251 (-) Transcript_7780:629-1381(-)
MGMPPHQSPVPVHIARAVPQEAAHLRVRAYHADLNHHGVGQDREGPSPPHHRVDPRFPCCVNVHSPHGIPLHGAAAAPLAGGRWDGPREPPGRVHPRQRACRRGRSVVALRAGGLTDSDPCVRRGMPGGAAPPRGAARAWREQALRGRGQTGDGGGRGAGRVLGAGRIDASGAGAAHTAGPEARDAHAAGGRGGAQHFVHARQQPRQAASQADARPAVPPGCRLPHSPPLSPPGHRSQRRRHAACHHAGL